MIYYQIFKRADGKYDVYKCVGDVSATLFKSGIGERAVKKYINSVGAVYIERSAMV